MLGRARAAKLHERLEDRFMLLERNPRAGVFDLDHHAIVGRQASHRDSTSRGRELHGVGDEIEHDLFGLQRIRSRDEIERARLSHEVDALRLRLGLHQRQHGVHHALYRHTRNIVRHMSSLESAVVEQIGDDAEQVPLASANSREVAVLLLRDRTADSHLE